MVVTEYGAAELQGKTVHQRGEALAAIAHPDFRDELLEAARARLARPLGGRLTRTLVAAAQQPAHRGPAKAGLAERGVGDDDGRGGGEVDPPTMLRSRFARRSPLLASAAAESPSASGTAPLSSIAANLVPAIAEAIPEMASAATAPSLTVATMRSRSESPEGAASEARAPAQPPSTASRPMPFTAP